MSNIDTSRIHYNALPTFEDRNEEYDHLVKKLIDYMKVDEVPELPSRQDELKYLKWLEKSVLSDPWVTLNPSKYMAGPNRLNLKSRKEMRKEYRKTFYLNGLTFMVLANPIIFYFANRRRYTSTGVPTTRVLPSNMWNPKYKLPFGKNFYGNRAFLYFFMKYNFVAFLAGGYLFTDNYFFNDEFNCRPDLNNFKSMVPISQKEKNAMNMFQDNYFGMDYTDSETSWFKRLQKRLFPSVDYKPNYEPFFDYKKRGYFPEELSEYYSRS